MKNLTILFLVLFCTTAQGQILKTTNLDLNPGGVIYDVAYDSNYDAFVVVGNFTSINGILRTNLAFIDANNYSVLSYNPITSINGEIRSVEIKNDIYLNHPSLGFGSGRNLFIGGNFNTINGQSRTYLARLSANFYFSSPPIGGIVNYSLNTWNASIENYGPAGAAGVYDMLLHSDTIVVAGNFEVYTPNAGLPVNISDIISLNVTGTSAMTTGSFHASPSFNFVTALDLIINSIEKFGDKYYLSGKEGLATSYDGFIYVHNLDGSFDNSVSFSLDGTQAEVTKSVVSVSANDTTIISSYRNQSSFGTQILKGFNLSGVSTQAVTADNELSSYKDFVYTLNYNTNQLHVLERAPVGGAYLFNSPSTSFTLNNIDIANSAGSAYYLNAYSELNVSQNKLFLSNQDLTTVNGMTRSRFAIFCLEPHDAEPFYISTTTACEGETAYYAIPRADFADGYRWTYTGTGALYRITGSGNPWTALSTNYLDTVSANNIQIQFPSGSAGGTLTVEPYSVCNTTTDYQFGDGQSMTITVNANPDINLAPTYTLNCYSDTLHMVAQSTMPNVTYDWTFNAGGNTSNNDTILITATSNGYDSSDYNLIVTNPLTLCSSSATTFFTFDLMADPIDPYLTTTDPLEWNCLTDSMTLTSNNAGYSITWEDQANLGTFYSDPYVIHSTPSSLLNIHGIQLSNGCPAQAEYGGIVVNTESADPVLVGHPNFLTDLPDDSLSCLTPSISLQCDVAAAYLGLATAQWTNTGTDILNLTTADSAGMDVLNLNYYTIVTTHTASQCLDSTIITVRFDLDKPYVFALADDSFNCSQSDVTLTHPTNGSATVIEGWLDGTGAQTGSNILLATTIGDYYYQVLDTENGCTNVDTVTVTQTLDLLLNMPSDTLICPDEVVSITPTVIGNTETPSYLWSTGSTAPSESGTGGIDAQLSVTVTTPSGCIGTDTTTISITPPIQATITPIIGCTDGNLEVTSISGGAGNYQYSLDGSTWQTSTNFSGLAFDDYTVSVLDDLGCIYDFDQALDGTAMSIEMSFAASTYNEEGDTIVLVNITDFTGLDSVAWGLPASANVFYEEDSMVILSIATGGWYDVELYGYLGANCVYTQTKPVYFGTEAPIFDSTSVNGIQTFTVSPVPFSMSGSVPLTVHLVFGKAQNYSIIVTSSLGQPISGMSVSASGIDVTHDLYFPVGTATGIYHLHVIADYDAKQELIMVSP